MSGKKRGRAFSLRQIVVVCFVALLLFSLSGTFGALGRHTLPRATALGAGAIAPRGGQLPAKAHHFSPTLSLPNSSLPTPNYDEQLGLTFTETFSSLVYNVTAVKQQDSLGYGPAYLLNGLSNKGYWYQVGVSWDWPFLNGGYSPGFGFNFEVFSFNGSSIFPANSGGLDNFSGPVIEGDLIQLSLSFSGTNVSMKAVDWNTSSTAEEHFNSFGASSFVGSPGGISNSKGFFSGLMTEQYHTKGYASSEKKVVYESAASPLSSAWMWVDEFNANTSQVLFYDSTSTPVLYSRDPLLLHYFFSNGSTLASNSREFVTGSSGSVQLTLDYAVLGSSQGFSPILTYVDNGTIETGYLGQFPTTFIVDLGSTWNVSQLLPRSSPEERWFTPNATSGLATTSITLNFLYFHQYLKSFSFGVVDGGSNYSNPRLQYVSAGTNASVLLFQNSVLVWLDAGSSWTATNPLDGSTIVDRWFGNQTSGISSSAAISPINYFHQTKVLAGYSVVNGGANYSPPFITSSYMNETLNVTLTSTAKPLWLDSGAPWVVSYLLPGSNATQRWEALSFTGTVSGGRISPEYYHQRWLRFEYFVTGGGAGYTSPEVNVTTFGAPLTIVPNATYWVDYLSGYDYARFLGGSNSSERWIEASAVSGVVLSQTSVLAKYQNQYFVSIASLNNATGGSVTPPSGWYNASTRAYLSAASEPGWKFFGWLGIGAFAYSGNNTAAAILVNSPLHEEAEFYPGVTIFSGSGGSVFLNARSQSENIQSGGSRTIFVPPNSQILLSASPSSPFEMFNGWNGSIDSGRQSDSFLINRPVSLGASFGFNYVLVMVSATAAILILSGVIFVVLSRHKKFRAASLPS